MRVRSRFQVPRLTGQSYRSDGSRTELTDQRVVCMDNRKSCWSSLPIGRDISFTCSSFPPLPHSTSELLLYPQKGNIITFCHAVCGHLQLLARMHKNEERLAG